MEIQIAGINMEISERTQAYIEKRLGKISKHIPDIIDIQAETAYEKTKSPDERYVVRVTVKSGISDTPFHAEERGKTVRSAVDTVADILVRQLESYKGRLYDKTRKSPSVRGNHPKSTPSQSVKKVVKTKRFTIEPLSTELAIQEMEELGHSFYLFLDDETDEMRLLYKRKDGNYGLIEPEVV